MRIDRPTTLLLVTVLLTIFVGGCTSTTNFDPSLAAKLGIDADNAILRGDYDLANRHYREAIRLDPRSGRNYLRLAELHESIESFDIAIELYREGIKQVPQTTTEHQRLLYRYGLAIARNPARLDAAREVVSRLSGPEHEHDLLGYIALQSGDPDAALRQFSKALKFAGSRDQQARIYYHAALANYGRNNPDEAGRMLFHAVNNAGSLALKNQIQKLYDQQP